MFHIISPAVFSLYPFDISYCDQHQREQAYAIAIMFVFPRESSFAVCLDVQGKPALGLSASQVLIA